MPTFLTKVTGGVAVAFFVFTAVSIAPVPSRVRSSAGFGELGFELRQQLEEVADESIVGDLEDRRFRVLVDRDDDLAVLHAGQMLDGTRDADGDVKLRCHDLAGLANLEVVRHKTGVHRGARGAHGRAELV